MFTVLFAFFLGVLLAPAVRPLFRPVMVELVRAGLAIVDEVKRVSAQVQESVDDAKAEVDATRRTRQPPPPANPEEPPAAT